MKQQVSSVGEGEEEREGGNNNVYPQPHSHPNPQHPPSAFVPPTAPEVIFEKEVTNTAPNLLSTTADLLKFDEMLADDKEDVSRRKKMQEAAEEAFARQMQEEERKKPPAPEAASARKLPEVDCQMHRLKKDAADLMEENVAQQRQLQQSQFDLLAAQAEIDELRRRRYVRQDFDALRNHQHQRQQHQQHQQQPNNKDVWYTKTTKRKSPVKVGGQYVNINLPPTYHNQPFAPTVVNRKW